LKKAALAALMILLVPSSLWAFGSHDNECVECHDIHTAQGAALIGVEPFEAENPSTGTLVRDSSSLCLGCHSDQGGVLEVDLMKTHPIGIIPKRAQVPQGNLSLDGTLTCTSCHDPHPSNPNYMYLRTNVSGGSDMGSFCEVCHPGKRER
jgi:predicted CXXCH cytochrome family protein